MSATTSKLTAGKVEWTFFLAGLVFCLALFAIGFSRPILDQYAFRQTQTAISTYWLLQGGPWLAYQTPVLGAPWAVPFEFPLYQWIVAIFYEYLPGFDLDEIGRLVSELFFLCSLWPLWRIATHHRDGRSLFLICGGVLLFSPLYVFWSRTFMMESAALFFSIWFSAATLDYFNSPSLSGFAELTITGALAACIKITTFVGFSFAGALFVLYAMYSDGHALFRGRHFFKYIFCAIGVGLAVATLWIWVHYSDALKTENLIGQFFTGKALATWNFGTLAQRKSMDLYKAVLMRGPDEAIGTWAYPLIIFIIGAYWLGRQQIIIALALLSLYVAPFFVFTNLHMVHHYYQYANSIFLVLALGYVLFCVRSKQPLVGVALLIFCSAVQAYGYKKFFYNDMLSPNRELQTLLALYVRTETQPTNVVVGFGLTWSSEVPYYGERKAILVPDRVGADVLNKLASSPSTYTGGKPIAAVIVCPNDLALNKTTSDAYTHLLKTLTAPKSPYVVGYCVVYH